MYIVLHIIWSLYLHFSFFLYEKLIITHNNTIILCFLVVSECAPRSVHLCLRVGAVIVCTSLAGDPGQQGGEG